MATATTSAEPESSLLTLPINVLEHIVSLDPFPWAPVSRQLSSIATSPFVRATWLLHLHITTQPHLPVLSLQHLSKDHFDPIAKYMEYTDAGRGRKFGFQGGGGYTEGTFPVAPPEFIEITEDEAKLLPSRMTTTLTEERNFLIIPGPHPRRKISVRRLATFWRLWFFRIWIDQTFPFTSRLPPSTFFSEDVVAILLRRREATNDPDDRAEIDSFLACIFAHIVAEPDNPVLKTFAQLPDLARAIPPTQLARIVEYAARHAPTDLVPTLLQNYYISPPMTTAIFVNLLLLSQPQVPFLAQQNTAWHLLLRQDIPALTVLVDRGGHTCYADHLGQSMLWVYLATVWPGDLTMVQILLRGSERVFEGVEDSESNILELVLSPAIKAAIRYLQPISILAFFVSNIHPAPMAQHISARSIEKAFETSCLLWGRNDPYEITDFMLPRVAWTVDDITYLLSTVVRHAKYHRNREGCMIKVARKLVARGAVIEEHVVREAKAPEELVSVVTGAGV